MSFLEENNIKRFRRLLDCEPDTAKRSVLEKLLANEREKLAAKASPPEPKHKAMTKPTRS